MMEEEQTITYHTVTLGEMTRSGDTLAEIDGDDNHPENPGLRKQTVLVPAGLPGERVTIAVEAPARPPAGKRKRRWKSRPPRVWISEIHEASPLRIAAPCPVFGTCGGCQLQHMQYGAQLEWKRSIVRQLLHEVGNFENPPVSETVACDDPWHYRNHMRFSVNRSGQPGLTARGTHRVLPLASCPIAHTQINRALDVLSTLPNARPQVLLRCGTATGQMLIQPRPAPEIAQRLSEAGIDVCTETMEEVLAGETFRIRPSSFFQTNTAQAEKMVQMVLDGLLRKGGDGAGVGMRPLSPPSVGDNSAPLPVHPLTIVDAYCGVGTFALLLARHVDKVIAIEESASAIRDAQENLRQASNVEILKGKVEDLLPQLATQINGLVIDPPRAGCQRIVLDALVQHPVASIVYVSCDPSTLARDLNVLCHTYPTYRLRSVQPLDMFPQTAHIECVAVLECL
jgi:23S rRNA (uracil1939-C5)-methyltransferase